MELPRAQAAVEAAGLGVSVLDEAVKTVRDRVPVGTMHLGKGLEFRAVAVMACDDEVLPWQPRIEAVADEGDLEEVYDSAPLELRRALLLERGDALGVIGRLAHDRHVRGHQVEMGAQVELQALVDEPLDHPDRNLRTVRDL